MRKMHLIHALTCCALSLAVGAAASGASGPQDRPRAIGEWTSDCEPGFRLATLPNGWAFNPEQGPLVIVSRVAVDFELLPADAWTVLREDAADGEVLDLVGYTFMALEARISAVGGERPVAILDGVYSDERPKDPVLFEWSGRDQRGRPLPAGLYQIEVRGRFVPVEVGLTEYDGYTYRDLEGWSMVAEVCTRVLTVELIDQNLEDPPSRGISCPDPPTTYYDVVDDTDATTLRATLHPLIDDHTRFPYSSTATDTWDILNNADENPSNPAQLLDVYKNQAYADGCSSGCAWNREHVWSKSFGFPVESGPGRIPYTDCHHLHAGNPGYNSARGNLPLDQCTSGCTAYPTDVNNGFGGVGHDNYGKGGSFACPGPPPAGNVWQTWDHRQGDAARSMMYMDLRYAGDSGALGDEPNLILTSTLSEMLCSSSYMSTARFGFLSTLITWSNNDAPDVDEQRRNKQVWCYQGNRNPFVDHPEWVNCLFLNDCTGLGPVFSGIDSAVDVADCADSGVLVSWTTPSAWRDGCSSSCNRRFKVYRNGAAILLGGCGGTLGEGVTSCVDTNGTNRTVYTYTVEAINHVNIPDTGGTSAAAGDFIDNAAPPTITSGPSTVVSGTWFTADWSTDEPATSYLEWDVDSGIPYANNTSNAANVIEHSLMADGLTPEFTYYYRVCSTDPCGDGTTCSSQGTVTTTLDCQPDVDETPVFINELHYDNTGTDQNEFVEVAGPTGTDLTGWTVALYTYSPTNNWGTVYDTIPLSGTIPAGGNGYGAVAFNRPGIDNGAPDGLALVNNGVLVPGQFLCYEGDPVDEDPPTTFVAHDGPALNTTCTNIGVYEPSTAPLEQSLQLTGGPGFVYQNFTWTGPTGWSPNSINTGAGQVMSCGEAIVAPDFEGLAVAHDQAPCLDTGVYLEWTSPADWMDGCSSGCDRGFRVYRDDGTKTLIATGGCASPLPEGTTSCVDTTGTLSTNYTYSVVAFNDLTGSSDGGGYLVAGNFTSDGVAPVLTTPHHSLTTDSFTVSWRTDELSDAYLEWGTSQGVYTDNTSLAWLATSHYLTANSLTPATTYYYRVCSTDSCVNGPACSAEEDLTTLGGCSPGGNTPVFINEFHYDNTGTDVGEFIEIAGPAGTNLGTGPWTIVTYNGDNLAGSVVYGTTIQLSGTIDNEQSGYGALDFQLAVDRLQNGPRDGLALIDNNGDVVQYLCYEGSEVTAVDGPAAGITCTNIGVEEWDPTAVPPDAPPAGNSLQLIGSDVVYEGFEWRDSPTDFAPDSPGDINADQTFTCGSTVVVDPVQAFTATSTSGQVKLEWVNPSIADYSTTRICWDTAGYPDDPTACVNVQDVTGTANTYSTWTHAGAVNGTTHYYAAFVRNTGSVFSAATRVRGYPFVTTGPAKWRYTTGAVTLAAPGIMPGAVGSGAVYGVSNDRLLHAMNPSSAGGDWPLSGSFSWEPMAMNAPAQHRPPIIPLAAGLRVFLASQDGRAYSVNARTGGQVWESVELGDMLTANPAGFFSDLVPGAPNLLFVGTRNSGTANTLYALNPATGAVNNSFTFTNAASQGGNNLDIGIITGVLVDYSTEYVYFTSRELAGESNQTVWCLDVSGSSVDKVWSAAVGNVDGAPSLYNGRVYVGTNASRLYALDAATGTCPWGTGGSCAASNAYYNCGDGVVKGYPWPLRDTSQVVVATTNTVWSITDNGTSSSLGWTNASIPTPSVPLSLVGSSHLLVSGSNGRLYQLNAASGAVSASLALGSAALGSPAGDVVNGMALVGAENGVVHGVAVPLP